MISLDGCRAGWYYVSIIGENQWEAGIVKNIDELCTEIKDSDLTLIDIPIGLRSNGTIERLCDLQARKILTRRKSSIFPAPHRLSLNCIGYTEACNVNKTNFGRGLSRQSWGITSKIKEIDEFIYSNNLKGKVREIHPEVCFWALNSKREMNYNKKKREGFKERLELLSRFLPFTNEIVDYSIKKYNRKELAVDDILDALSGIPIALQKDSIKTIPEFPEIDDQGFPMEMVYAEF